MFRSSFRNSAIVMAHPTNRNGSNRMQRPRRTTLSQNDEEDLGSESDNFQSFEQYCKKVGRDNRTNRGPVPELVMELHGMVANLKKVVRKTQDHLVEMNIEKTNLEGKSVFPSHMAEYRKINDADWKVLQEKFEKVAYLMQEEGKRRVRQLERKKAALEAELKQVRNGNDY